MRGVAGKRVLVTAAGAGIGRALAAAFLSSGARVWICDIDAEALAATKDAHPELGGTRTDVADEGAVDALFGAIWQAFGGLDVLVNNAGIAGPTGPIEALDPTHALCCGQVGGDRSYPKPRDRAWLASDPGQRHLSRVGRGRAHGAGARGGSGGSGRA
jgi:NAD(P)-dependent dehydrogenase (short-subunit alcohol dehydrogenase family)